MKHDFSRVHPDLRPFAQRTPAFLFSHKYLWLTKLLTGLTPALRSPEDIVIQNRFISSGDQEEKIKVRFYRSKSVNAPTPALIWMHGGGYVMGKPEMDDWRCVGYAREAGITVVSVDYRLAPKHPFPAGMIGLPRSAYMGGFSFPGAWRRPDTDRGWGSQRRRRVGGSPGADSARPADGHAGFSIACLSHAG